MLHVAGGFFATSVEARLLPSQGRQCGDPAALVIRLRAHRWVEPGGCAVGPRLSGPALNIGRHVANATFLGSVVGFPRQICESSRRPGVEEIRI
jgi:hypothetical protein